MKRSINRFFERNAIPNLTMYIIFITGVVSAVNYQFGLNLGDLRFETIARGEFWHIFLFPFWIRTSLLGLAIYLYIFWIFAASLEDHMGTVRFNQYILLGMVLITIGGFFFPRQVDATSLDFSIFIAVAYLAPEMEILLFFIFPVKIKWLAIFGLVFMTYQTIQLALFSVSVIPFLGPILALGNFIVFYGAEITRNYRMRRGSIRRRQERGELKKSASIHRCTVCGRTEITNPELDFRYCVECSDHEYCMDHLYNHEHIQ